MPARSAGYVPTLSRDVGAHSVGDSALWRRCAMDRRRPWIVDIAGRPALASPHWRNAGARRRARRKRLSSPAAPARPHAHGRRAAPREEEALRSPAAPSPEPRAPSRPARGSIERLGLHVRGQPALVDLVHRSSVSARVGDGSRQARILEAQPPARRALDGRQRLDDLRLTDPRCSRRVGTLRPTLDAMPKDAPEHQTLDPTAFAERVRALGAEQDKIRREAARKEWAKEWLLPCESSTLRRIASATGGREGRPGRERDHSVDAMALTL